MYFRAFQSEGVRRYLRPAGGTGLGKARIRADGNLSRDRCNLDPIGRYSAASDTAGRAY